MFSDPGINPGSVPSLVRRMEAIAENTDEETAHYEADELLCEILRGVGYGAVVDAYEKVGKWYA